LKRSAASENHELALFLAERYISSAKLELAQHDAQRARAASSEPVEGAGAVRYLGSALIPSDETCFALFQAPSAEAVHFLLERADLHYDRIVQAVRVG
jgi:hypothetical protein